MRRGHRPRRCAVVVALAACLLVAACGGSDGDPVDVEALLADDGSAAPTSGGAGTPGQAAADTVPQPGSGLAGGVAEEPGPAPSGGSTPGAPGVDDGAGGSTAAAAGSGSPSSPAPATGGAEAVTAPGGPLKIGIHVSEDLQAAYGAFGASGAEGDVRPALEAVVAWINDNGGMGGRPVQPVFHGSDALNGSFDSQAQTACAHFTEDDPVFAVVSGAVLPSANLPDCLVKKRTPLVWNYHYLVDGPLWDRYLPYLYMPFSMSGDRLAHVFADELVGAGFLPGAARVAIIRYDNPQHQRFSQALLRPRLEEHGVDVVEEIALRQPPSAAGAGDTAAQISNAILRLRASNVSHVVFVPTGGAVPFIFMSEAESQGFRPRYGLTSLDIPYFVSDQAPAGQLEGSLAIGWSPASDTHREQQPLNGPRELCYRLTNSQAAQRFCDGLFFLKAALDRTPRFDAEGLQAAVEALGTAFDPVFSLATRFGPHRHDGADAIRLVTFDGGCACFQYTGPVKPLS